MCVFLISPVPIAEPLRSELNDTLVFHNLAPGPIKYQVSNPSLFERLVMHNIKTSLAQTTLRTMQFPPPGSYPPRK